MKRGLLFLVILLGCAGMIHAAAPIVSIVSPGSGFVGTTITIAGSNFNATAANNIVMFGATRATVVTANGSVLTVTVPAGATYGQVTVLNTATGLLGYSPKAFIPTYNNGAYAIGVNFAAKIDSAAGVHASDVAIGDLDGDGKADLVVTNSGDNTVSVFRNTSTVGAISYAAKVNLATGTTPVGVSLGDVDGNGKLDIVVANSGASTVSVLRNTSTSGTISFAAKVDLATGGAPYSVAICDLDGDGKNDLATANVSASTISVLRNTGSVGAISFAAKIDFTAGTNACAIAAGDLDGDGKADLAAVNLSSATVSVFRNTGSSGTISYAAKVDFATGQQPTDIAIGDLDGDGKADIATANSVTSDNTVSVLRNTGSSGTVSFAAKADLSTGANSDPYSVAIGDIDGDGKADLAAANENVNTVSVFRNVSSSGIISFAAHADFATGTTPNGVAIGDMDGDGKADIATANYSGYSVSVLRNNPTLLPAPVVTSVSPNSGYVGATVTITGSNFNANSSGNVVIFGATRATVTAATATSLTVTVPAGATYSAITVLNTGSGLLGYSPKAFTPTYNGSAYATGISFAPKIDSPGGVHANAVAIGDIDGDGKADIAVANAGSNNVSIFRNTSTAGTISYAAKVDFATGNSPFCVAIGDVNGDGKLDLAIANVNTSTVSVLRNLSVVGSINFAAKADFVTGSAPYGVAICDIDGDGRADLAVANLNANTMSVLRNTGSGGSVSFAAKVDFTTGSNPAGIVAGDLDGDGKADIAVPNLSGDNISVLRNTGSIGTIGFAAKQDFATGGEPISLVMGDMDGDGKNDIGVTNAADTTISVLRNTSITGTVSFAARADFGTGPNSGPYSIAMGDMDGDGKADIAVAGNGNNTAVVLRNTGTSGSVSFATRVIFATGVNPNGIAIGDLDGDGRADMVTANYTGYSISIFRNNAALAPATISGTTSICAGLPVTINFSSTVAGATVTYTINGGAAQTILLDNSGNAALNFTPAVTDTFTLTQIKLGNDSSAITGQSAIITVLPLPTAFMYLTNYVCFDSSAGLSFSGTPNAVISYQPGNGFLTLDVYGFGGTIIHPAQGYTVYTLTNVISPEGCVSAINQHDTIFMDMQVTGGFITGPSLVTPGNTIVLTDSAGTSGGVWSSSNTAVATIAPNGVVTGVAGGIDTIFYSINSMCGSAIAKKVITVGVPGYITGQGYVCAGSTMQLTDSAGTPGGVWSSTFTTKATVSQTGVVTGIAQGVDTIKYTLAGQVTKKVVTVYALPVINAGADVAVCPGMPTTLSATGGTSYVWSPGGGLSCTTCASPVATPTITTSYVVTGTKTGCSSKDTITVTLLPALNAGFVTGPSSVVINNSITLADSAGTPGGTWSSANNSIATVNSAGVVTGMIAGTNTITYAVTNTCGTATATKVISVLPPPSAGFITGQAYACTGSTMQLTDSAGTPGGVWSSTFTAKATVNQSGVVTGVAQGVDTIKYTVNGTLVAKKVITVYNSPVITAGNDVTVCQGTPSTLTATGGTSYIWTPAAGLSCTTCASPVATPSVTTTYVVKGTKTGCSMFDTVVVNINPAPFAGTINGPSGVAPGSTINLTSSLVTAGGGTWSSTDNSKATVDNSGLVTGVAVGTDTIKYTVTNGCGSASAIKVITIANTGTLTGLSYVCVGSSITITDSAGTPGGVWSSVYTAKATVNQSGVVTGVSQGVDTIKYTIGGMVAKKVVTVYALPVINAGNDVTIAPGGSVTLTATGGTSYVWTPATGLSCTTCASPVASPAATTSYVVTGTKTGCSAKDTVKVTVSAGRDEATTGIGIISSSSPNVKVYPNPAKSEVYIDFNVATQDVRVALIDLAGRQVAEIANLKHANGAQHLVYNVGSLARGVYYVQIALGRDVMTQKIVVE